MSEPFSCWAGSKSPTLVFVGEAWGQHEEMNGSPFSGPAGAELTRMLIQVLPGEATEKLRHGIRNNSKWWQLRDAWLHSCRISMTNLVNERPPNNNFELFCCGKKELPSDYPQLSPVGRGSAAYLKPEYLGEVDRLRQELSGARPNIVVPTGAIATWGVLGRSDISNVRGTTTMGSSGGPAQGLKVLPTYHPSAIIRGFWKWRPIVIADLMKAFRESHTLELVRPERFALVQPTLEQVIDWCAVAVNGEGPLAADIETAGMQITCIGFATDPNNAITIPFRNKEGNKNYWAETKEEVLAWESVRTLLECGRPLVFHNGMYDIQFLARMGFNLRNAVHDTMLLHHSHYPEMQKALGFLGTIYTNEQSWKLMGRHRKTKEKGTKLDE